MPSGLMIKLCILQKIKKHNLTMGEIHEQDAHGLNSQMCMTDTLQLLTSLKVDMWFYGPMSSAVN